MIKKLAALFLLASSAVCAQPIAPITELLEGSWTGSPLVKSEAIDRHREFRLHELIIGGSLAGPQTGTVTVTGVPIHGRGATVAISSLTVSGNNVRVLFSGYFEELVFTAAGSFGASVRIVLTSIPSLDDETLSSIQVFSGWSGAGTRSGSIPGHDTDSTYEISLLASAVTGGVYDIFVLPAGQRSPFVRAGTVETVSGVGEKLVVTGRYSSVLVKEVTAISAGTLSLVVSSYTSQLNALPIDFSLVDHDDLFNSGGVKHIDWTNATEDLLTTGTGAFGDTLTLDGADATDQEIVFSTASDATGAKIEWNHDTSTGVGAIGLMTIGPTNAGSSLALLGGDGVEYVRVGAESNTTAVDADLAVFNSLARYGLNLRRGSGAGIAAVNSTGARQFVVESDTSAGGSILAGASGQSSITFGSVDTQANAATLSYSGISDLLTLGTTYTSGETKIIGGASNLGVWIDTAGNVGIKTAVPGSALDVAGDITVSGTVDGVDVGSLLPIDNTELSDMAAYTIKMRNAGTTGDPGDVKVSDLTEEASPGALDWILGELASGELRKFDVGNLPSGGILAVVDDTTPQLGGMLDVNGQAIGDGTRELLTFVEDASAVNHVEIENQAAGGGPIIRATGDDSSVSLILETAGDSPVVVDGGANPASINLKKDTQNWEVKTNNSDLMVFGEVSGNTPVKITPGAATNLLRLGHTSSDQADVNGSLDVSDGLSINGGAQLVAAFSKAADETVNSSSTGATLQDDDHLVFSANASEIYLLELTILASGPTEPGDLDISFTVPTGAVAHYVGVGTGGSEVMLGLSGTGVKRIHNFRCFVFMSTTAGDIQFQWAQNVAGADDTIIYKGSLMKVWES